MNAKNSGLGRSFSRATGGALALCALLSFSGCAQIQQSETQSTERMLAAAGFQMKFAKTPAQSAQVAALPQRKLTRTTGPDGAIRFVWADATDCKCIYVGTEAAYDRYQKLGVQQEIAEENEMASMDWDSWGGWGPAW
ncbi:hypothetical protein [Thiocapsa bogorovii]|uniref:hypothetical protein n=1 Tax=Thiocapsa bogorovii TaxID=521689 RepID=UPI001E54C605|nr:hypothetical protein [Thiocapsa bogorovii]UHD17422.1 hypothetical protein LT988_05070 [Thiocapsa bogorovii]